MTLHVHFLPSLIRPEALTGSTLLVIDVLRATTTITQALAAGTREVIPCLEVDEARRLAVPLRDTAVLGGERSGQRIAGFNLGNSPREYTPAVVKDKILVFTTTNGTRAMQSGRTAKRVLLGAFLNLSAVVNALQNEPHIALLCAGTDGHITQEDVLFAGAVVHRLCESGSPRSDQNDEALLASAAWQNLLHRGTESLVEELLISRGGRNLVELGMSEDVRFSAKIDTTSVLGELLLDDWRIRTLRA